jgi:hypothetical protein
MEVKQSSPFHWLAIVVASAGAGALVYWWRLARPLWVDEEMIALNARWRPFGNLAGPLWLDQSSPLAWLALERMALLVFGVNERAGRALPVLFGVGTLAVAVWVARRWMTPVGAVILAVLCSTGPWLVFFTLELKQYSADACFALLLPALTAWAAEADSSRRVVRRAAVWWISAAASSWFSNGATFVAPACAAVLIGRTWQQHGLDSAAKAGAPGILWLVSFGAHYMLVLRHALDNEYLRNYWGFAFPPVSSGASDVLRWTVRWFESFAVKPVGTAEWPLFWVAAIGGYAHATARYGPIGVAFAAVPVSALALGILHVVPPFERLGLWCVPALYVGVAWCGDAAVWLACQRPRPAKLLRQAASIAAALAAGVVSFDIARNGKNELDAKRPDNNYGLDDRRAVRRVQTLRQAGDPVLTTHFGLPGLWWYIGLNISDPYGGGYLDDSPIFEISHETRAAECMRYQAVVDAVVQRTGRAVLYLGFRMNVEPEGFDQFVLDTLSRRGAVVGYARFAELSHVAAFNFKEPPVGDAQLLWSKPEVGPLPSLEGCLAIKPARRW